MRGTDDEYPTRNPTLKHACRRTTDTSEGIPAPHNPRPNKSNLSCRAASPVAKREFEAAIPLLRPTRKIFAEMSVVMVAREECAEGLHVLRSADETSTFDSVVRDVEEAYEKNRTAPECVSLKQVHGKCKCRGASTAGVKGSALGAYCVLLKPEN
eukprot:scaffold2180_cov137-Isochrysis_galbana.AAC.3